MACNCLKVNVIPPINPPSPCPGDCLKVKGAVVQCADSVGPCLAEGSIDLGSLNDLSACPCAATYTVISYDTEAFHEEPTFDSEWVLTFTTADGATPNTFGEIIYMVSCGCNSLSALARVQVCIKNPCPIQGCGTDEMCEPCTGCVPIVEADVEVEFVGTPSIVTADAVNDTVGNQEILVPHTIDVKTNDTACSPGTITSTWELVAGSETNCSVVDNGDGTFDYTPFTEGAFSFQYNLKCGVVVIDTATVSGTGVVLSPCPGICECDNEECTGSTAVEHGGIGISYLRQNLDGFGTPTTGFQITLATSGLTDPSSGPTNQLTIDWGDASIDSILAYGSNVSHTYAGAGTFTITVQNVSSQGIVTTLETDVTFNGSGILTTSVASNSNEIIALRGIVFGDGVLASDITANYTGCPVSVDLDFTALTYDELNILTATINAVSETVTNDSPANTATWTSDPVGWTLNSLITAVIEIEDENDPGVSIATITSNIRLRCQ